MAKTSTKQAIVFNIKSTKEVGNELIIEGYANPTTVDRMHEIMPMDCWQLTNYMKTGVVLFNHDRDQPIGKMIEIKPTPEGLYLKCRISKSRHPDVARIRDMIRERILNAFSVGFLELDFYMTAEGIKVITRADLYEVSVVTVPMNQDAIFTISSKQLKKLSYDEAAQKVLEFKGADAAIEARAKAHSLGLTTEDVVKRLSDEFKIRRQEAWDLMSGNKEMNAAEKKALADMLDKKKKKPAGDEAPPVADAGAEKPAKDGKTPPKPAVAGKPPLKAGEEGAKDEIKPKGEGENPFAKKDEEGEEAPAEAQIPGEDGLNPAVPAFAPKKHALPAPAVHAVLVPTSTAETAELAIEVAATYGFTGIEAPLEEADGWIIIVRPEEDFMGELATMTIGDGVLAHIGVLVPDKASKDATGEAGPGEEGSEDITEKDASEGDVQDPIEDKEPTEEEGGEILPPDASDPSIETEADPKVDGKTEEEQKPKKGDKKKHFDSIVARVEANEDASFRPAWAGNAKAWEKAKAASLAEHGKLSYAFIVTQYIESGTAQTKAAALSSTKGGQIDGYGGEDLDTNPIQEGSKQTHILLGALISEVQGLRVDLREQTNALQTARPSTVTEAPQLSEAPVISYDTDVMKDLGDKLRFQTKEIERKKKLLGMD